MSVLQHVTPLSAAPTTTFFHLRRDPPPNEPALHKAETPFLGLTLDTQGTAGSGAISSLVTSGSA